MTVSDRVSWPGLVSGRATRGGPPRATRRLWQATTGRSRSAYTLIELLVVIGVITLLIAVALPVLSTARQTARTTVCLSNVRQVGVLLNAYLVDSDGMLPTLNNRGSTAEPGPALDTFLLPPGGDTAIYECPADDRDLYETTGNSYLWNVTVNGQPVDDLFSIIGGDRASRVPLVSDKEALHPELEDKIVVLYADGHAQRSLTFTVPGS